MRLAQVVPTERTLVVTSAAQVDEVRRTAPSVPIANIVIEPQARNTAADLGQTFSDLRRRNFDLYGAALLAPQLTVVPALDQSGMLHLVGYIPTRRGYTEGGYEAGYRSARYEPENGHRWAQTAIELLKGLSG